MTSWVVSLIKNISRNGTRNVHHITRRAVAMTMVMSLVLFYLRIKLPDFILNKDHPLSTI